MACSSCSGSKPDLSRDPRWRRALWIALGVNGAMFAAELAAGLMGGSKALQADALDSSATPRITRSAWASPAWRSPGARGPQC